MGKADLQLAGTFDEEDQRATRRQTIFRGARIFPVSRFTGLAIRDLSEHGLTGESPVDLILNQAVHFSHDGYVFHQGRVGWTHGAHFGLVHTSRSGHGDDKTPVSHGPSIDAGAARTTRIDITLPAVLAISEPMLGAIVRNISEGGAMFEAMHSLRVGTPLLLTFDEETAYLGHVAWSGDRKTGVRFASPQRKPMMHWDGWHRQSWLSSGFIPGLRIATSE